MTVTTEPEQDWQTWHALREQDLDTDYVELVLRGGRYAIRQRDPGAPSRVGFRGVPTFEVDPAWVVTGHYSPYGKPVRFEVATARADLRQHVTAIGTVHLALGGSAYELGRSEPARRRWLATSWRCPSPRARSGCGRRTSVGAKSGRKYSRDPVCFSGRTRGPAGRFLLDFTSGRETV